MTKTPPLIIGLPANGRLAEECAPLFEALELSGRQGRLTSPFVPDAVFRKLRVKDIARLIKFETFGLGIMGDDTALEEMVTINGLQPPRPGEDGLRRIKAPNKLATFNTGAPSTLTLMAKEEEAGALRRNVDQGPRPRGRLLTSYPRSVGLLIKSRPDLDLCALTLEPSFDGQLESIVRNGDVPNVRGAVDVVKTGRTLKEFGLTRVADLLESRPGLWSSPFVNRGPLCGPLAQLDDVAGALRERLTAFMIAE